MKHLICENITAGVVMLSVDGTHSGTRLKKELKVETRKHSEDEEYSMIYLSHCDLFILENNLFPILLRSQIVFKGCAG